MITFVSLFLGLVTGVQTVEVALSAPAASVEVALDDQVVATLVEPPWKAALDFGRRLRPYKLEAVARDAAGREIGRARQWINLPRSQAEMALALLARADGSRAVRVILQQAGADRSMQVRALLDGEPLAPVDRDLFALPPYDPATFHLIEAEAQLAGGAVVTAHLGVGGQFGGEVGAQMTAVPLRREAGKALPKSAELEGALEAGGHALPVLGIEEGAPDLMVVLDPGAASGLGILGALVGRSAGSPQSGSPQSGSPQAEASGDGGGGLSGFRLHFVSPQAARDFGGTIPFDVFPVTQAFTVAEGSVAFLLTHVGLPPAKSPTRISDALAAAGVRAAAGNRPRALLLIVCDRPADESRIAPADARAYLEDLRVPLVLWSTGRPGSRAVSEDRRPLNTPTPWGPARDVSTVSRYTRAVADLERALAQQFIAWVEGAHLPQSIALAGPARRWALEM